MTPRLIAAYTVLTLQILYGNSIDPLMPATVDWEMLNFICKASISCTDMHW